MPSLFDSIFSRIGYPALGIVFGEPAEYVYRNGTVAVLANVIIDRNPPEVINEKGEVYQPTFLVQVAINPNAINTGGDKIRLREHASDTTYKTYSVTRLTSQGGLISTLEIK